jgi:hypothetical protein
VDGLFRILQALPRFDVSLGAKKRKAPMILTEAMTPTGFSQSIYASVVCDARMMDNE